MGERFNGPRGKDDFVTGCLPNPSQSEATRIHAQRMQGLLQEKYVGIDGVEVKYALLYRGPD